MIAGFPGMLPDQSGLVSDDTSGLTVIARASMCQMNVFRSRRRGVICLPDFDTSTVCGLSL